MALVMQKRSGYISNFLKRGCMLLNEQSCLIIREQGWPNRVNYVQAKASGARVWCLILVIIMNHQKGTISVFIIGTGFSTWPIYI